MGVPCAVVKLLCLKSVEGEQQLVRTGFQPKEEFLVGRGGGRIGCIVGELTGEAGDTGINARLLCKREDKAPGWSWVWCLVARGHRWTGYAADMIQEPLQNGGLAGSSDTGQSTETVTSGAGSGPPLLERLEFGTRNAIGQVEQAVFIVESDV